MEDIKGYDEWKLKTGETECRYCQCDDGYLWEWDESTDKIDDARTPCNCECHLTAKQIRELKEEYLERTSEL
jgi:hypothetical protein